MKTETTLQHRVAAQDVEIAQLRAVARRAARHLTVLASLPPEALRMNVGTRTTEANFWFQGLKSSEKVRSVFGDNPTGPVLDWGCGSGRTANWLLKLAGWNVHYWGCDVDKAAIAWLQEQSVERVAVCNPEPPLPYADAFFEGLFCFSVLTHIQPSQHRQWYEEIGRVLKPGGRALCTVQGEGLAKTGTQIPGGSIDQMRRDGFAHRECPGHYKSAALVSEEFTRAQVGKVLTLEDYTVAGYANMDCFVLRKQS